MEQRVYSLPLIGDPAPSFKAVTTKGVINYPEDYKGKWSILFSHPADFTPVCTTEFMTFAKRHQEFRDLNTELVGLSVDALQSHIQWLRSLEDFEYRGIKNAKVDFPLIVDITMEVSRLYGMIHPNADATHAVRAVFIVDPKGIIRTIFYYPASAGRNFDELIRIVQALQYSDKHKVATPADWQPGDDAILPPPATTAAAIDRMNDKEAKCQDWYFCFKEIKE
ncbi:MAG: peroxiredoxin [Acholeplasmataceae bacterium]|jgi:peroxiredoxin (alkyl hydroperoxide reductase subunit C)|nr:peroxiredoxin [Acholeplasmataceae bacterium]